MLNSRLKDNENFICLLKEYECPEEVTSGILKFSDRDFNLLLRRVKEQPDLLVTLVKNGYDNDTIKRVFCEKDDEVYNTFLKYKEFVTLLLENKCELKSVECVYNLVKYDIKPDYVRNFLKKYCSINIAGILGHRSKINMTTVIYDYLINREKIVSKLSSLLQSSEILKCAWEFISSVGVTAIDRYRENPKLFYLIMKNGIINNIALKRLSERYDYKSLNIRDNKQLLDFLLNKGLITLDRAKQGFIADYPLVSSLLKVDALTISELENKSIEEMIKKVETLTKERISKKQEQLGLPPNLSKRANLSYVENGAQSLQTFALAKVAECLQNKNTFLKAAEVTSVEANSSMCSIS